MELQNTGGGHGDGEVAGDAQQVAGLAFGEELLGDLRLRGGAGDDGFVDEIVGAG
ncbi:hypothetical protein [Streptomyces sp. NPDC057375]|uniref:hypothetical protein n=1 Tax=Streptomyces sp. NPDC057375 TaxID=3346109 RepID=UPI00363166CC